MFAVPKYIAKQTIDPIKHTTDNALSKNNPVPLDTIFKSLINSFNFELRGSVHRGVFFPILINNRLNNENK